MLELGRYRFFKSVSVFGFSARTYHCLSNNTIADTLRPPLSPNGVWALEFALQIAARDSDIVTIDNL